MVGSDETEAASSDLVDPLGREILSGVAWELS